MDLSTLADDLSQEELSKFRNTFQEVLKTPRPRGTSGDDAYVFDDENKEEAEVKDLKEKLGKLKIVARAKVTEDRIYSAAYHPEPTKDLIFFGGKSLPLPLPPRSLASILSDKHGQLGIWDARAPVDEPSDDDDDTPVEDREGGKFYRLQMHWPATSKSSISSVKFDPIDAFSVRPPRTFPINLLTSTTDIHQCIRLHHSVTLVGIWHRYRDLRYGRRSDHRRRPSATWA